jgi:hypothetical protein
MSWGYGKERLALYEPLLKTSEGLERGKIWALDPKSLRFKLGETVTELKVPYHMGVDDEECINSALKDLLTLLKKRFDQPTASDDKKITSFKDLTSKPESPILDRNYRTDMFAEGTIERSLTTAILENAPLMDSAILKCWLEPEGQGRKFLNWCMEYLEKALREEAGAGGGEMTSYMALLALFNTVIKLKDCIKTFWIKGVSYERLDLSTGFTLYLTVKTALEAVLERTKKAERVNFRPETELALRTAVMPRAFLLIPSNMLASSLNPYGINSRSADALSPCTDAVKNWPKDFATVVNSMMDRVEAHPDALMALEEQYYGLRMREFLINYLTAYDLPGVDVHKMMHELYREDRQRYLRDPKTIGALGENVADLMKRYSKDQKRVQSLMEIGRFVESLIKRMQSQGPQRLKGDYADGIRAIASCYASYRLDEYADSCISYARGALVDRRAKFSTDMLKDEFNNGRLYRFSTDNRPMLKALTVEMEGHMMIDMKDFTKKTLKLKEIAMADYMKENFYEPIMEAASGYSSDKGLMHGGGGINIKGMPGDAAIFSGEVACLVALAKDIQRIIRRYREEVKKKFLPLIDRHIEYLQKKYASESAAGGAKSAAGPGGPGSSIVSLKNEAQMITEMSKKELEDALTEEMEAGLFISYGIRAESMVVEAKKGFSSAMMVAIGEKINEAARGTARSAELFSRLTLLCENERRRRKCKALAYPFDIFIDRVYGMSIPEELEARLEAEIADRQKAEDSEIIKRIAVEYKNDLEKIRQEMPLESLKVLGVTTAIYNRGQALSADALKAYFSETKATRTFFKRIVRPAEFCEPIRGAYFFPHDPLEFWFAVEKKKGVEHVDAFLQAGEITFKGFESSPPIAVYEIIDVDGSFFKALMTNHFKDWLKEAEGGRNKEKTYVLNI